MTESSSFLDNCLKAACTAAELGGKTLFDWRGRFSVREKSRANLVTEADEASQQTIYDHIHERFPKHGFLGEEGLNENPHNSEYTWVIDPLDGTSNYVHGFPYYAVSIALQRRRQLLVGAIYDPNRHEMFTAVAGGGAFLNGEPIHTSGESELSYAMGMASLPIAAGPDSPAVHQFLTGLQHLQTVQRTGSAALNLASVASGRVDVFWSTSLKPWDVAAGILLVQEAGGTVTNMTGGTVDIMVSSLMAASSSRIQKDLSDVLNRASRGL
ncbi:MAG: inositol monophosphatase family protein [Planctomycetaceae bacterium]|jgi:myo-inositol-1(or 4)-monophosphatase